MTGRPFAAKGVCTTARLLLAVIVSLALHSCDGGGSSSTATLTVRTKRYMGVPATAQYAFTINYFGQGPSGSGCASSFSEPLNAQGSTDNQGNAYDDKVFLNACPGSWNITVGIDTWTSGGCQQTLAVGNNHAYFTYGKPGCNSTSYP